MSRQDEMLDQFGKAGAASLREWRRDANPSLIRILDGALSAIARQGTQTLSMTDIAAAAGVSRATLYRYFSQKDDVLAALGDHISNGFIAGVQRAATNSGTPLDNLRAVVQFVIDYTAQAKADRQLEVEPQFVLGFLRAHFAEHVEAVTVALTPFYDYLDRRLGVAADRRALTEGLLRFSESTSLVPGGMLWQQLSSVLPQAVEALLGSATGAANRRPESVESE